MVLKKYNSYKFLYLLLFLLAFNKAKTQHFNTSLINKYPKSIVVKVYDIYTKIKVDTIKQRKLAEVLLKQEDSLLLLIRQSKNETIINDTKIKFHTQVMNLLEDAEQILYSIELSKERSKTKFSYSSFLLALQSKDSLHLSKGQIDSLVNGIVYLKHLKDSIMSVSKNSFMDTKEYESTNLSEILNVLQYKKLLDIKNLDRSMTSAKNDWEELEERTLTNGLNKEQELLKLKTYYLERNNIYDQYAHDSKTKALLLTALYNNKPRSLMMLIKAKRSPNNDTLQKNLKW